MVDYNYFVGFLEGWLEDKPGALDFDYRRVDGDDTVILIQITRRGQTETAVLKKHDAGMRGYRDTARRVIRAFNERG